MNKQKDEIIEIFSGTPWEAEIIKSQLNDIGITAFILDDIMGTLAPWQTSAGGMGAAKVTINSTDYEKAKIVIEDFNRNK